MSSVDDLSDYIPYEGKTIREVIDDYVLVRGDLVDRDDPYAREQLASIVEGRIRRAVADRVQVIVEAIKDHPGPDPSPASPEWWTGYTEALLDAARIAGTVEENPDD